MIVPFTKAQIEDMMQRIFNQSREYFKDEGIYTVKQWLETYGPEKVADAISSDRNIYSLYLETSGVDAYDVMEAYVKGEFAPETPKSRQQWKWDYSDLPGINGPWTKQKNNLSPEDARNLWQLATGRLAGKNKEEILEARRQLYIAFASDAELAEKLGIKKSELNKKMRNIAFVSVKQMQMEDQLNRNIPEQFNWTGISNSSFLLRSKFTVEDIQKFVLSFSSDNEETMKLNGDYVAKHLATTFLAINSHVSYDDLAVHLGKTSKKTTRGQYLNQKKMIVIDDSGPNTVAHEIGHYLDHKWGDEIEPGLCISDQSIVNTYITNHLSESHRKWIEHFRMFMRNLIEKSNISNEYSQRFEEVFARFTARFVGWVTNNPYISMDTYNDEFSQNDFAEFVKLLQEKSYVDAEYKNKTASEKLMIKKKAETDEKLTGDKLSKVVTFVLPDTDRYTTDDYGITTAIQETGNRVSIGVYVTCYKIGVSGYQQYWHFDKSDSKEANATYEEIKKIVAATVEEIKENEMPSLLIKSFLHRRLNKVNRAHIEKMGVTSYNWDVTESDLVEDWRESLYGGRYPTKIVENFGTTFDQENKKVETSGSSRNRRYYYKSSGFIERTVKTADLRKIMNLDSNENKIKARIPMSLVGHDVPINRIEIYENNEWTSSKIKTAKQSMAPWLSVALIFGLVSGFELNNQLSQDNQSSSLVNQQPETNPSQVSIPEKRVQISPNKPIPRGIRNNNPGNIEMGKDKWLGSTTGQDDRFITFEDPRDGIRAIARILLNYQKSYKLQTVRQIINRWAPPKENDTNAYIDHVAKSIGIKPDQPVQLSKDKNALFNLTKSIILHENGFNPYDDQTIRDGVESSLSSNRPWASSKNMPVSLQSPKERINGIPQNFVPPFESKQTDVFKRQAHFRYAFNNIDRVQARVLLYKIINDVGTNWKDIAKVLREKYDLSPESMRLINTEFLKDMATFAKSRWRVKYSQQNKLPLDGIPEHLFQAISLHVGGRWEVLEQNNFKGYAYQKRGTIRLLGHDVMSEGDQYYVHIEFAVKRARVVPPLQWGEPEPVFPTEKINDYDPTIGHALLSFRGIIEGKKDSYGRNVEDRHFPIPSSDPRWGMVEIGAFGNLWDTTEPNPTDTPYEVAVYIKNSIDKFWSDFDGEGPNETEPDIPNPSITSPEPSNVLV